MNSTIIALEEESYEAKSVQLDLLNQLKIVDNQYKNTE